MDVTRDVSGRRVVACAIKARLGQHAVLRMALAASAGDPKERGVGNLMLSVLQKAVKSGSAGFMAGTMQVLAFMWLRTVMNYQYKHGGSLFDVLVKLWQEGGIARLYRGLFPWAILQAPLSRFGDLFSNTMMTSLLEHLAPGIPVGTTTFAGSMAAAAFRVVITPIDTVKTTLQTDGENGMKVLRARIRDGGIFVMWSGWDANYVANVVGNYPYFATMNVLQKNIGIPKGLLKQLIRNAFIGACCSSVSDVSSNSIRVVKTKKQTSEDASLGYVGAVKQVIDEGGIYGLMFRGLETRLFTNILQGAFFTVTWKYLSS